MYGIGLLEATTVDQVATAQAAGTSDVNSDVVDTQNYEGVIFVTTLGTAAANNGIKIQGGEQSDLSDAADLLSSSNTPNKTCVVTQVHKPRERYVRAVVVRGTSTTVDSVVAYLYGARTRPAAQADAGTPQSHFCCGRSCIVKVKFLTRAAGKLNAAPGDTRDVDARTAKQLIEGGYAQAVESTKKPKQPEEK